MTKLRLIRSTDEDATIERVRRSPGAKIGGRVRFDPSQDQLAEAVELLNDNPDTFVDEDIR